MNVSTRENHTIGVVIIGRNEGERLERCIDSVREVTRVVYVDSCSTDHSVSIARSKGVTVVELDPSVQFTAALARNEGFRQLREMAPHLQYVQFVDGDCEIVSGWLEKGSSYLRANANLGAVCGRLREKHPETSVYNMLCDIEWDTPIGEAKACGGIVMMRVEAFESTQGFRADLIAGEEPELCVRLRRVGWRIWRLDEEMALHDAALKRFSQWWKRALRCGYAFAQGADLHGASPERHCIRESRSAWFWALGLPMGALICVALAGPAGFVVLGAYPLQVARLTLRGNRSMRENWWHALFLVIAKVPEMAGQVRFLLNKYFGSKPRLIEHKLR